MSRKIIFMLIAFLFIFQLPAKIFAVTNGESNDTLIYLESQTICELENNRTENSKFFLLKTGEILETRYLIPIHKQNQYGTWEDIYISNDENLICFAQNTIETDIVTIYRDDYEISWKYEDMLFAEFSDLSKTHKVYKNVFKNVDLDYVISENNIKESLVLNDCDTRQEFIVNYKFKNLKAYQADFQTIKLLNENNKTIYTISAPEMFDSAKISSKNLSLEILNSDNEQLKVKIICDKTWLNEKSRIYPIIVDPNVASERREWTLVPKQLVRTGWQKKRDNKSIFLDLEGSDFGEIGIVYVCVYGRRSGSGTECGDNCTFSTVGERVALGPVVASYRCYLLEANKKYELLNIVNETGCDEYDLRFYNSGINPNTQTESVTIRLKAGWNPDFIRPAEREIITVGNVNKTDDGIGGNSHPDSPLNLIISPNGTCYSSFRTKSNTTSIYLDLTASRGGGNVTVQIFGTYALYYGGYDTTESVANCTYNGTSYTLTLGKKYYLWNTVRESKRTGVYLKFSGTPGTEIKGKWSPDYFSESGCERRPCDGTGAGTTSQGVPMKKDQVPIKIIDFSSVYADQKSLGLPRGCELASTYMLLKKLSINVTVDELLSVVPCCSYRAGVNPLEFFIGNPKGMPGTFGCFNPVISGTINCLFNKKSIWDKDARIIKGKSMSQLIHDYINKDIPLLIWATSDLRPLRIDKTSVVLPDGTVGPWPGNEHCMVLIGYNNDYYFVANPENNPNGTPKGIGAFPKDLFEQRYSELGCQAVVVEPCPNAMGSIINKNAIFSTPKPGEIISRGCDYLVQSTRKDGQEAHKLLQRAFEKEYAKQVRAYLADTEVCSSDGKYRYDIILIEKLRKVCEIYDIKPFRHHIWQFAKLNQEIFSKIRLEVLGEFGKFISRIAESKQGTAQLKRYIDKINTDSPFKLKYGCNSARAGTTYLRSPKTLASSCSSRRYLYTSHYDSEPGIIYWIYKNTEPQKEYEAIVVRIFELIKVNALKLMDEFSKALRQNKDKIVLDGQAIAMDAIILTVGIGLVVIGIPPEATEHLLHAVGMG